jgi:twitching motility protein PilT
MTLEAVLSQMLLPSEKGGRVLAMEIMRANTSIRSLIHEGKFNQIYSSIQSGQAESNMQTMNQSLLKLVVGGYVSKELAATKSSNPEELADLINKRGFASKRAPNR